MCCRRGMFSPQTHKKVRRAMPKRTTANSFSNLSAEFSGPDEEGAASCKPANKRPTRCCPASTASIEELSSVSLLLGEFVGFMSVMTVYVAFPKRCIYNSSKTYVTKRLAAEVVCRLKRKIGHHQMGGFRPDVFEWLRLRPVVPTMRCVGVPNLAAWEV